MKGESTRIVVVVVVTALILAVNRREAGSVLEPTIIHPSPPAVAAMISAQHHESLIGQRQRGGLRHQGPKPRRLDS
jgi:hypothetical protein